MKELQEQVLRLQEDAVGLRHAADAEKRHGWLEAIRATEAERRAEAAEDERIAARNLYMKVMKDSYA